MIRARALLAWLAITLCLALAAPLAAQAQAPGGASTALPDTAQWERVASRAEAVLETGRASDGSLETLRAEIVGWREEFLRAQTANAARIETTRTQIAALGPAPGEGETEADQIAERRAALNDQLNSLMEPRVSAEVAYSRADGMIREIDQILRDRQASRLLELGPSPLNPTHWATGAAALGGSLSGIGAEVTRAWSSDIERQVLRDQLPVTVIYLLLAIVLILRGHRWTDALSRLVLTDGARPVGRLWGFLISFGQVMLPLLGLILLVEAAYSSGLAGLRGSVLLDALPDAGAMFFTARWLGGRVFPKRLDLPAPVPVEDRRRREGRTYATAVGLLIAVNIVLVALAGFDSYSEAARAVLNFPLALVAGLILARIGQLILAETRKQRDEHQAAGLLARIWPLLGRLAVVIAIVGPVLSAVGYRTASNALLYPSLLSLALLGTVFLLQRLVGDFYLAVTRGPEEAREGLIPVLIGFALSLMALPVLALIWGLRVAELTELWTRFREGISIGETQISPTDFLTFALVFAAGFMLTRLVQGALRGSILPKTNIDVGGRNAIVAGTGYTGIFLAAVIAITAAGIDLSGLAIVAGALSVGIGFGLQNIVSNFVSGIILLIERPISEGDWIEVGGHMGYVRDISVRSTRVETFDRTDVIIPNADLVSGQVTNFTRGNSVGRAIVPVGVAYGTDTRRVEAILREIAEAHPMVILNPPPGVLFRGFGADSLDFEIRAILRDVNWVLSVKSDMNHEIARRFAEEGIEIPFAQRDVWLRNPEALRAPEPAEPAPGVTGPTDAGPDDSPQDKDQTA